MKMQLKFPAYARLIKTDEGLETKVEYFTKRLNTEEARAERKKDGTLSYTYIGQMEKTCEVSIIES